MQSVLEIVGFPEVLIGESIFSHELAAGITPGERALSETTPPETGACALILRARTVRTAF